MIKLILAELATPDDQGRDWYGWCSNQMAHALLGAVCTLFFAPHGIQVAVVLALLKESVDLTLGGKWLDSAQDVSFWALGAWLFLASDPVMAVFIFCMALVCGVVPRLRKSLLQPQ